MKKASKKKKFNIEDFEVRYERCCGIDVHKDVIYACILADGEGEVVSCGANTEELLKLCDLLISRGVEMTAMESTASYWKPIFNVMEVKGLNVMLVNSQHVKGVPGRKTDIHDSEWIARLLRHGLLNPSNIPCREDRELKEIVRYRGSLVEERTRVLNRMDKVLQGANIKLSSVMSGLDTKSGISMLWGLAKGETDEEVLASMAMGSLREKKEELETALRGLIQAHQQFMLKSMLQNLMFCDRQIAEMDMEISKRFEKKSELIARLDAVTGIGIRSAEVILSEIGSDMSRYPTAEKLASWAAMCPGSNTSAGKNKSGRTRRGNNTLKTTLVQCAKSAGRTKNSYLGALYRRLALRIGANKAAVAVGHRILIICYHLIKDGTEFKDLGPDYFNSINRDRTINRAKKQLEKLGLKVTLEEIVA